MGLELWTIAASSPRSIVSVAERAEAAGVHGVVVTDSQNLAGDCYVALAAAAASTTRLGLGTGVTNPVTRHPAVTASAIAAVQELSGGRAVLGIGRGDSALAHLGRAPASVEALERYLIALQAYLRGDTIAFEDLDFHERLAPPVDTLGLADTPAGSRLAWLRDGRKVPVEVAATGPRVIDVAGRHADRVLLAVGADPERVAWGVARARAAAAAAGRDPDELAVGAYVNVVAHPDRATARAVAAGGLATFARFAVMHGTPTGPADGDTAGVLRRLHAAYDMRHHTRADAGQVSALPPEFVDRYGAVGPADECVARLRELAALGVDKVIAVGPTAGADREAARVAQRCFTEEVVPAFAG